MSSKKSNNTLFFVIIVLAGVLLASLNYKMGTDSNNKDMTQEWGNWGETDTPKELSIKSYKEALEMSEKTGKPVFLFFHADRCNWCEKMKVETFANPDVQKALNKYIVYHADGDKEKPLVSKYGLKGVPSYFVIDSKEKVKKSGTGYKDSKSFIKWLNRKSVVPRR